jgi:hypothetical protein
MFPTISSTRVVEVGGVVTMVPTIQVTISSKLVAVELACAILVAVKMLIISIRAISSNSKYHIITILVAVVHLIIIIIISITQTQGCLQLTRRIRAVEADVVEVVVVAAEAVACEVHLETMMIIYLVGVATVPPLG